MFVSSSGIVPSRFEVRVGERVRWQAAEGQPLRLEMDPHQGRDEHEVATRHVEVRAVFFTAGEHWYRVTIGRNGRGISFRGTVIVRNGEGPRDEMPVCSEGSSLRVCFAP